MSKPTQCAPCNVVIQPQILPLKEKLFHVQYFLKEARNIGVAHTVDSAENSISNLGGNSPGCASSDGFYIFGHLIHVFT